MIDMRVIAEAWMFVNALLPIFGTFATSGFGVRKNSPIMPEFTGPTSATSNAVRAIPPLPLSSG